MISRELITDALSALKHNDQEITKDELAFLRKIPVYVWKMMPASSWHHTGKYFNKTDHYDLINEAYAFLKEPALVDEMKKKHQENLNAEKSKKAKPKIALSCVQIILKGLKCIPHIDGGVPIFSKDFDYEDTSLTPQ